MYKNTIHTVTISALSSEGAGIAHLENGLTVFVPCAVTGDTAEVLIIKETKSYAVAKLLSIKEPSSERTSPPCPIFQKCGGCDLQSLNYDAQLEFKKDKVLSALQRIGGFEGAAIGSVTGSREIFFYRNKAQFPVAEENGRLVLGFFAPHSHRVVPTRSCCLIDKRITEIANFIIDFANENRVTSFDERTLKGELRKICIRAGKAEAVVVLVCARHIKAFEKLTEALRLKFPIIKGVVENFNSSPSNTIYSDKDRILFGTPYITDSIGNIKYKIHYRSFYQVNPYTTELLYEKVRELCGDCSDKTVFDLYCGTGTIGLFLAKSVKKLVGVEIVPEAVINAKENAALNSVSNAEFYCGAAEKIAPALIKNSYSADIVVLDPPRKGCGEDLLRAIGKMSPEKIVYVSCDPATMARDAKKLSEYGYALSESHIFDQFPQTNHVETVVMLSQLKPDDVVQVELNAEDLALTSAEAKATYEEIKTYVKRAFGFKVSSLYIAQVKQKMGLPMGKNYNVSKKGTRVPLCPPEKEEAILEALRHYKMI